MMLCHINVHSNLKIVGGRLLRDLFLTSLWLSIRIDSCSSQGTKSVVP